MWTSKYGNGYLSPGDLVRSPVGTVIVYEMANNNSKLSVMIQSYASRYKAKLLFRQMYCFNTHGEPCYMLKVKVLKQGIAKRPKPC